MVFSVGSKLGKFANRLNNLRLYKLFDLLGQSVYSPTNKPTCDAWLCCLDDYHESPGTRQGAKGTRAVA